MILKAGFARLNRWQDSWNAPLAWRLYWMDKPGAVLRERRNEHLLQPDTVYLIPPETYVEGRLNAARAPGLNHLYIHFRAYALARDHGTGVLAVELDEEGQRLLGELNALFIKTSANPRAKNVLIHQLRLVLHVLERMPEVEEKEVTDPRILRVMRLMQERFGEPLTLDEFAARSNMAVASFARRFKRVTSISPHQFLTRLRLSHAKELLVNSDAKIDTIAEKCGFADRQHFTRTFRKLSHHTPAAYRRFEQQLRRQ